MSYSYKGDEHEVTVTCDRGTLRAIPLYEAFDQLLAMADGLREATAKYENAAHEYNEQIVAFRKVVNSVYGHYQSAVSERDRYAELLVGAEGRLNEVQRVLTRYTTVNDPVVASDGFTYERRIIKQYLDDCQRSSAPPISQQTQSELTSTLIPNQSLKKLIELLKATKSTTGESQPLVLVPVREERKKEEAPQATNTSKPAKLHPCERVYGYCNYKETCTYAKYPYEACLSHLKGKCRFGLQCHELHVDWRGPNPHMKGVFDSDL